jgi:hypothetical protein
MNQIEMDKIKEICKKWNLTELNFTKGIFMDDKGITVDLRGDSPIIGVTIAGTLYTEGHGSLRVPDLEIEIMNALKPFLKPSQSFNDKKAEVKDDSHKKSEDQKNVTKPQETKGNKTGGQESSLFKSQSTEQKGSNPISGGINKDLKSISSESKLGTPDKLQKAKCKDCNLEFEITLAEAQKIFEQYDGIYCQGCLTKSREIKHKEKQTETKKGDNKVMETKIKMCSVCGIELSGARALECFQKDPQKPVFKCEVHETAEPEHLTKTPQPDTRLPVQTHTPQGIIIKGFQPSLKEIGKIKIGSKGEERPKAGGGTFRIPVKFDHFEIVSIIRNEKGNFIRDSVMDVLGESPKEVDIFLLFNDPTLNFITRYNQYYGGKCLCQGDGETAKMADGSTISCNPETCQQFAEKKCKPNGILSVILAKSPRLGGVYKFRTTSFNSIRSILSSMFFLSNLTGGVLAMIPLKLTVSPMQVQPKDAVTPQTIHVVNIEFSGTASELLQKTFDMQKYQSAMRENIIKLENSARAVLTAPESKEEIKEIEAEFYPSGATS